MNSIFSAEVRYGTLIHELAQLYCGHLGTPNDRWWPDRQNLSHGVREFEAESVKSHLSAALGLALVENGWRVLFARTTDLVQQLQIARRELALESAIAKLDRYDLLILDDIAYVTKDKASLN